MFLLEVKTNYFAHISPPGHHDIMKNIDVLVWYQAELKLCGVDENVQAGNRCVSSVFFS